MSSGKTEIDAPGREIQAARELQPIALRSMFWRPAWLQASAWQEHVPFAFWLVDAHRPGTVVELGAGSGTSYFSVCQAVERLGLNTRCFGVDEWKAVAGEPGHAALEYEDVLRYNEEQYSGFSRLVRSSFDDARQYFADGSIDMLHIDGGTSLDAVSHDFESWLPKLSGRGIVVLHNTNVRESGHGAHRFFDGLRQRYPTFEFVHGRGLGVIGVGADQGQMMRRLFDATGSDDAQWSIREVFSRLGRSCADAYTVQRQREDLRQLGADLDGHRHRLGEVTQELAQARELLEQRREQDDRHSRKSGYLVERVRMLQETKLELKEQVARLQAEVDGARQRLDAAPPGESPARSPEPVPAAADASVRGSGGIPEVAPARQEHADLLDKYRRDIETLADGKRRAEASLQARFAETAQLTRQVIEHQQKLAKADAEAKAKTAAVQRELDDARRQLDEARAGMDEARATADELRQRLQAIESSRSWRVTSPLRRLRGGGTPRQLPAPPASGDAGLAETLSLVQASGLFSKRWYLERYPDVAASGIDPIEHYIVHGAAENRDPSASFSTARYLALYPDVAEAGENPLVHYLTHGRAEGRIAPESELPR